MKHYNRIERFLSSRPFKFGIMVVAIVTLAWCLGYYLLVLRPSQAELRAYLEEEEKVYLVPERNGSLASASLPDTSVLKEVKQAHNSEDVAKSHSRTEWNWNATDDVSDSSPLIVDKLDTHKPSLVQSDSDVFNEAQPQYSDALLDEAYDNLYIAKDTLDQLLPALVDQLNSLSPEQQRETLRQARLVMMDYLSPEAKKLLKQHPDLVDKGWNFLLAKLQDSGYELPD